MDQQQLRRQRVAPADVGAGRGARRRGSAEREARASRPRARTAAQNAAARLSEKGDTVTTRPDATRDAELAAVDRAPPPPPPPS